MKPEPKALASLSAVIGRDLDALKRLDADLAAALKRCGETPEFRDLAAIGYLLHNLYNALENSFEQVSRTFENHVVEPSRWHRELLDKMFLSIPGVRPAVLPGGLRRLMHELRGFRHLFRHSYDFELDATRLAALVADWQRNRDQLFAALQQLESSLRGESESP